MRVEIARGHQNTKRNPGWSSQAQVSFHTANLKRRINFHHRGFRFEFPMTISSLIFPGTGCKCLNAMKVKCQMAMLVNPTRGILFAHRAFDFALSPPHFPTHWLPFASCLIRLLSCFGVSLLAAVWEDFFSIDFTWALLFVFFPRPAPNRPILRLAHLFQSLLLLQFR